MSKKEGFPPQHQAQQPGKQTEMDPIPEAEMKTYRSAGRFKDKVVLVVGGDSGMGQAISIGFAKEGAKLVIVYKNEDQDAEHTRKLVEQEDTSCLLIAGDVGQKDFCHQVIEQTLAEFKQLDVLINHAGEQHVQENLEDISEDQLVQTFRTNFFSQVFMMQAALPHLKKGAAIVNTTSVTAYNGHPLLMDYSATNGARSSFIYSVSQSLAEKGIRVNGVAPGPIWTPLIPASFPADKVAEFGKNTPLGRAGQPDEVAPAYLFLASEDAVYITGQIIHVNGGRIVQA